ncbi:MAG TPA: molybdopterin-synthase adenylyltransferase MoeB [Candidatus Limnocylindria bacterium]|nr:molybdopterin-synthase adenylyltransferase MoeB [Candidatus Limnocylindria bacterium]
MIVRSVDAAEAVALAAAGHRVIDVRERVEWDAGHVADATLLPLGEVLERIGEVATDLDAPLLLHCSAGARSARAAGWLVELGYTTVANLDGSLDGWREHGGPWVEPSSALSEAQRRRYARQLVLPEIGPGGQRRLLDARVLVVGAGGLGSPVALYLAASGVGTIGIVDDDVVDESNLQRQVLHAADRIGMPKVSSAAMALRALNPETAVLEHGARLSAANVTDVIAGYDVVVDGTDNLDTRYLLNDAAVAARTPVVHGSVYRWDGQVTTLVPFEGPCYRCLHPVRPPDDLVLDCDVAGVLGVLPGIVGTIQAAEALKLLLGVGEPLVGRMLIFDALGARFDEIAIPRDPACASCGSVATRPAQPALAPTSA